MGYSHAWKPGQVTQQNYEIALLDIRKIIILNKEILADGSGKKGTLPEYQTDICINGIGEESHETFFLPAQVIDLKADFCKTDRKTYDKVVVACLTVLRNIGVRLNSDGQPEDWVEGLELARTTLDQDFPMPSYKDLRFQD